MWATRKTASNILIWIFAMTAENGDVFRLHGALKCCILYYPTLLYLKMTEYASGLWGLHPKSTYWGVRFILSPFAIYVILVPVLCLRILSRCWTVDPFSFMTTQCLDILRTLCLNFLNSLIAWASLLLISQFIRHLNTFWLQNNGSLYRSLLFGLAVFLHFLFIFFTVHCVLHSNGLSINLLHVMYPVQNNFSFQNLHKYWIACRSLVSFCNTGFIFFQRSCFTL